MRMIDDQAIDQLDDRLDQLLVLPVLDDQPAGGGAALAGAHIGRLDGDRGGGVNVLRVPDDERVVAAHFEREDLVRGLGELRLSARPARAEPVKSSPSSPGWAASALPASGPPWTQRTTPSGTPAS